MQENILVLNSGSSSIKFSLYSVGNSELLLKLKGMVSGLDDQVKCHIVDANQQCLWQQTFEHVPAAPQQFALETIANYLDDYLPKNSLIAAGHRIVHGGSVFNQAVKITPEVIKSLEKYIALAPLHQPCNLAGVEALSSLQNNLFQVACFDTAFHTSQPEIATLFALPQSLIKQGIKRYGFHGLSYEYITSVLPQYTPQNKMPDKTVVAHLGHGASMCALQQGRSIATTMGFTALDGLPMGTRCGDLDPGVILYLQQQCGYNLEQINDILYYQSGLKGISNLSGDMQVLVKSQDRAAKKAINLFCYRVGRELGSLVAALGGLECLVFTAGIGENCAQIRAQIIKHAKWLDLKINDAANNTNQIAIHKENKKVGIYVIPTNEELMIAQHTYKLWRNNA